MSGQVKEAVVSQGHGLCGRERKEKLVLEQKWEGKMPGGLHARAVSQGDGTRC